MNATVRLIRVDALSESNGRMIKRMLSADGKCACGRYMSPSSGKFILCNAVSANPKTPGLHGSLIAAAYCYDCASRINSFLASLSTNRIGLPI